MVQPLLELLRNYTGFHLVLLAGVALKEGSQSTDIQMYVGPLLTAFVADVGVLRLQAGRTMGTTPMKWRECEPSVFTDTIVASFAQYLTRTQGG